MNSYLWRFALAALAVVAVTANEDSSNNDDVDAYKPLADGSTPFQILRPDREHKRMIFNQESRNILASIPENPNGRK